MHLITLRLVNFFDSLLVQQSFINFFHELLAFFHELFLSFAYFILSSPYYRLQVLFMLR